jgi:hypothetical protein
MTDQAEVSIAEFQRRLEAGRQAVEQTIAGLSEAEIATPSTPTDWSVKDHIAHLAAWAQGIVAGLHRQSRWEAMSLSYEQVKALDWQDDKVNALIYEQHKNRSWLEVQTMFNETHQALKSAVANLTDADLFRPYSDFDASDAEDNTELVWKLAGNSFLHYLEHLPWMLARLEHDRAANLD